MRKIALVTHEFGLMRNGGGIASYLLSFARTLLATYDNVEVHVLTCHFHANCELIGHKNFKVYELQEKKLSFLGEEVKRILVDIKPDFVEVTDYLALGLEAITSKHLGCEQLKDSFFAVYTHTATREIYEWGEFGKIEYANKRNAVPFVREWAQMAIADAVMSPSCFLQEYVHEHYKINRPSHIPLVMDLSYVDNDDLYEIMEKKYDLDSLKKRFVISYISRFEGRKNQKLLIKVFAKFVKEVCPDALLILAGNAMIDVKSGNNTMEDAYKYIPSECIDNYMIFDFATKEDKDKIFSITDLEVMTSKYENFPVIMLEAVCHGVPIMTSVYSGSTDYMGKYESEMSFNPYNENDLYNKIVNFYFEEKETRRNIALEQRNCLKKLCTFENTILKKMRLKDITIDDNAYQANVVVAVKSDSWIKIDEGSNILILCSHRNADINVINKIVYNIVKNPGRFSVTLGEDCLHTNIYEAMEAEFPLFFNCVGAYEGTVNSLLINLVKERADSFFCVPIPEKVWLK